MKWKIAICDSELRSIIGDINLNDINIITRKQLEMISGKLLILENKSSEKIIEYFGIRDIGEYYCIRLTAPSGSSNLNLQQEHELFNFDNCILNNGLIAHVRKDDSHELRNIINQINKIDPIEEAFDEIYNFLQIRPETSQEIANQILNAAQNVPFREVLESAIKAQSDGYEDALLLLGKYYEENLQLNEATGCYDAVLTTNSKYAEAAYSKLHLLYNLYDNNCSKEEIISYQEEQLRLAIKSGERGQTKVDQLFYSLCGYETNIPDITAVQGNAETLISIARKMRALNTIKEEKLSGAESSPRVANLSFFNHQAPARTTNEPESPVATERNFR